MNDPYAPAGQYAAPAPRRSAIPKVIGILMIIFGSLGLLGGLIGLVMPSDKTFNHLQAWKDFERITSIFGIIGLPVSAMQLFTGIMCVKYKVIAPKLALVYGLLAALLTISNAVIMFGFMKPALDAAMREAGGGGPMAGAMSAGIGVGVIFGTIIGLSWPTVIIALMTRPGAKAACTNQ
jgi:hypothetical protein